jgi:hypothetical protein
VATYKEALAYEVKKGGKAGASETVGGGTAEAGKKPAGAIARQVTVTVAITAIDPSVPSEEARGRQRRRHGGAGVHRSARAQDRQGDGQKGAEEVSARAPGG